MASTNFTTHYGIPTPLGTDLTTPMDYNEAAEAIDTALFGAVTDAGNATIAANNAVNTANAASDDVDAVSADLAQEKAKITALQTRITNAENEIDDVRTDLSDMITAYNEPTATSSHTYAIGDYFIYNNTLYRATAAIPAGTTIVPDTNCETTNIVTELNNATVLLSLAATTTWADAVEAIQTTVRNTNIDFSKIRLRFYSANEDNYVLYEPDQYAFGSGAAITFKAFGYLSGVAQLSTIRTHNPARSDSDGLSQWASDTWTVNHIAITDAILGKIEVIAV